MSKYTIGDFASDGERRVAKLTGSIETVRLRIRSPEKSRETGKNYLRIITDNDVVVELKLSLPDIEHQVRAALRNKSGVSTRGPLTARVISCKELSVRTEEV